MELVEFNILYEIYKENSVNLQDIASKTGCDLCLATDTLAKLQEKGWILHSGITRQGLEELRQYKVDNAIIMAAGFGLRSLPRTCPVCTRL